MGLWNRRFEHERGDLVGRLDAGSWLPAHHAAVCAKEAHDVGNSPRQHHNEDDEDARCQRVAAGATSGWLGGEHRDGRLGQAKDEYEQDKDERVGPDETLSERHEGHMRSGEADPVKALVGDR